MAKKDDESKLHPDRPRKKASAAPPLTAGSSDDVARAPLSRSTLMQAIEAERAQLLQAYALLKCLHETLLYVDDESAVLHADVANVAARLIDEAVTRLDFVQLAPLMASLARSVAVTPRPTDAVRPEEPAAPLGHAPDKAEDRPRDYKVEDAPAPRYLC